MPRSGGHRRLAMSDTAVNDRQHTAAPARIFGDIWVALEHGQIGPHPCPDDADVVILAGRMSATQRRHGDGFHPADCMRAMVLGGMNGTPRVHGGDIRI